MADTSTDQGLTLRASTNGNGVGLTVLAPPDSDAVLVVHVLPKVWRPTSTGSVVDTPDGGGAIQIFEGDYVRFTRAWQDVAAQRLAPTPTLSSTAEASASDDSVAGGALDALWSREPVRRNVLRGRGEVERGHVTAMWGLLLSCGQKPVPVKGTRPPSASGMEVIADIPELKAFAIATFVHAATRLVPRRKPAYRSRIDSATTVRGRLVPGALIARSVRNDVRVTCEYDELTGDHRLWQVVRTALERCWDAPGQREFVMGGLAQLRDVATLTVREAIFHGNTLVPSIRDPAHLGILRLALSVLQEKHKPAIERGDGDAVIANLKYATSSLWEKLLERAFRDAGCVVAPQSKLPMLFEPTAEGWKPRPEKLPDLMVTSPSGDRFFIDAKYMTTESFDAAAKGDQYQAIAYTQRSGFPTLLAFATNPIEGGQTQPAEVLFRAIPPSGWSAPTRRPFRADDSWLLVGSTTFAFPTPADESPDAGGTTSAPTSKQALSRAAAHVTSSIRQQLEAM
ncbi:MULTISPECIES: hypothetical protein [unclassified Curtobacterium]|uniref:5-methylcytosine restriction system specificity protein McrC n=1 Tax=unclassified Curtobacterium TaxID=257496 RepID=UPI0014048910|nr:MULTISPECIES: hypothetical protein [unclassified Curtobacterium]